VVFCPPSASEVLQAILEKRELFHRHRQLLKEQVLGLLKNREAGPELSRKEVVEASISSIIDFEMAGFNLNARETRQSSKKIISIKEEVKKVRLWRLRSERHLVYQFAADVNRLRGELRFVQQKQGWKCK
jgi:hypothetical protein